MPRAGRTKVGKEWGRSFLQGKRTTYLRMKKTERKERKISKDAQKKQSEVFNENRELSWILKRVPEKLSQMV